jgi:large subunit ribosomal protein L7/L12
MAKLSTDDLLDAFKELTLLELSEFVKKFEETFEVTAAAPVAVAAAPAAGGAPAEAAEEQSEFDVILEGAGDKKIGVIKVVREIVSGLGLKEAKDLVDGAPKPLLEKVAKEAAEEAKAKLEAAADKCTLWGRSGKQIGPTVVSASGKKCDLRRVLPSSGVSYSDSSHRREACGGDQA